MIKTGYYFATIILFLLGFSFSSVAQTYTSMSDGNWSANIWSTDGGSNNCSCSPDFEWDSSEHIVIDGDSVTWDLSDNPTIDGGSFTLTNNATFYMEDKNFFMKSTSGSTFTITDSRFRIAIKNIGGANGSGLIKNEGATATITDSYVEIAQSWDSTSGTNTFLRSCMATGQNYSNDLATDSFTDCTLNVGRLGSGNFSIASGPVTVAGTTTVINDGSGSVSVSSSATFNGTMDGFYFPHAASQINTASGASGTVNLTQYCAPGGYADGGSLFTGSQTSNCTEGDYSNSCASLGLPIELIDFTASTVEYDVELFWSTASEINNDVFAIELSYDGIQFSKIAEVAGQGTSTEYNEYSFMHEAAANLSQSQLYYRLKQIDFNGQFSYSDVAVVSFRVNPEAISIYPNPASNQDVQIVADEMETIRLYSYDGKMQKYVDNLNQIDRFTLDISDLPIGLYIIKVNDNQVAQLVVD